MPKTDYKALIQPLRDGDLPTLQRLLRAHPDAARSPAVICEAGRTGSLLALQLLHRYGADLNASFRGYRPLHSLIQETPHGSHDRTNGDLDNRAATLKWMLANGADPEQLAAWPAMRALIAAAFVGEPRFIDELRKAGAKIDGFAAAALADLPRVSRSLEKDPAFATARDPGGLTALHCCVGSGMARANKKAPESLLAIANRLIDSGADVNATVRSWSRDVDVVYFAAHAQKRPLFELLLASGASPASALRSAVWNGRLELAEVALQCGAELDRAVDEGKPLLNQMIRWGQVKQALWMLGQGASPNLADENGWTAVHQAASRGNERLMQAVLEAGGDPSRGDKDGDTPLDVARARLRPKLVKLLNPDIHTKRR
jgi:ankyrin repeat protein